MCAVTIETKPHQRESYSRVMIYGIFKIKNRCGLCGVGKIIVHLNKMTTAARPTFEPARGGKGKGEGDLSALSKQYSSRDLPSHTKLKYR